jgi:hypothetical protein
VGAVELHKLLRRRWPIGRHERARAAAFSS